MSIRRTPVAVASATGLSPYAHAHAHTAAVMALAPERSAQSRLALVLEAGAQHMEQTGVVQGGIKKPPPLKKQRARDHAGWLAYFEEEKERKKKEDSDLVDAFGNMTTKANDDKANDEEADDEEEEKAGPKMTRTYNGAPPKTWAFGNM